MFSLQDKVALVVGGRGRLGHSFCKALGAHGATVVVADLPSTLNENNGIVDQYDIDVADPKSIDSTIQSIINKFEKIDVLIYSVTKLLETKSR